MQYLLSVFSFHNLDFLIGQPVQLVHQFVNLAVGGVDLTLVQFLVGLRFGGSLTLVQFQHLLDEFHRAVVVGNTG